MAEPARSEYRSRGEVNAAHRRTPVDDPHSAADLPVHARKVHQHTATDDPPVVSDELAVPAATVAGSAACIDIDHRKALS